MDSSSSQASQYVWTNGQSAVHHYDKDYGFNSQKSSESRWSKEHRQYESLKSGEEWRSQSATFSESKQTKSPEKGSFLHLFAGGVAGCASTLVTCPIDVIKTRQQSSGEVHVSSASKVTTSMRIPQNTNLIRAFLRSPLRAHYTVATQPSFAYPTSMVQHGRCILHLEGVRSFYKGLGPSLMGVVPSRALFFYSYDAAKKSLHRNFGFRANSVDTHIVASSIGGLICTTATCPLWLIKTKQQLHRRKNKTSLSMTECARRVWHNEGWKGFYRGLTASYAGIVETVLYFTIYEQLKALYIRKHNLDLKDTTLSMSSFWELPGLMVISSISKCSATCVAYPHEVVRTRLREEPVKRKYNGFFQTVKQISAQEGLRGLYGGLPAQLIRQVPNMAILMGVYEGVVFLIGQ